MKMAYILYKKYHLFKPRDETGIAASPLLKKIDLFDGVFFDRHSIRELRDESNLSNNKEKLDTKLAKKLRNN